MDESHELTLSGDIKRLLALNEGRDISLGDIAAAVGDRGFGILFVLLSLPSALPVPAPGYSTPFGIVLFILSLQLLSGRPAPWLPEWASEKVLKRKTADRMINTTSSFFRFVEKFIRPRFSFTSSPLTGRIYAVLLLLMSGLMILPIPLTNTLPAMVIFFVGIALTERDGLALAAAMLFGITAVALYSLAVWVIVKYGAQELTEAREIIRGWFL